MIRYIMGARQEADVQTVMEAVNRYIMYHDISALEIKLDSEECDIQINAETEEYKQYFDYVTKCNYSYPLSDCVAVPSGKGKLLKKLIGKLTQWRIADVCARQTQINADFVRAFNSQLAMTDKLIQENTILKEELMELKNLKEELMELKKRQATENSFLSDEWYVHFEDYFRGDEESIAKRNVRYLPLFRGMSNVIDIGCGRGEFLSMLKENDIQAQGVDLNKKAIDCCLEKGLKVVHGDGIEFLSNQRDGSVDGIFGCQVVEHLSLHQLSVLLDLAYQKLMENGVCVLETVNPLSLGVFCYGFYIDPTHKQPIHPATLRFMAQEVGFETDDIHFVDEFPEEYHFKLKDDMVEGVRTGFEKLDNQIFGAQDYYIVCRKKTR